MLGHVLTGMRLAIGVLWIVLVPSEMLGASAGLGYAILDTRGRLAYSELMAMITLIGTLGFSLDLLTLPQPPLGRSLKLPAAQAQGLHSAA